MVRKLRLLCFMSFGFHVASAQVPAIEWSKCLGGGGRETVYSIVPTPDGGSVIGGNAMSTDGDITCQHDTLGWWDFWLVRLDSAGNIQWTQCYGGSQTEISFDMKPTSDGGYILCGYALSTNGDVTGNHGGGNADVWIVKVDAAGVLQWQKCYGGAVMERAREIIQTQDGGYAFIGATNSNSGDVSGHHDTAETDIWVGKIDSIGTLQWQKCLGGTSWDEGYGIVQADDGSYWVTGESWSADFDGIGNHGYFDYFLAHLDTGGNKLMSHSYGGTDQEFGRGIIKTNRGFVLYGLGSSSNGDVVGNINNYDYWIVCIDTSGAIVWQNCLGGTNSDGAYAGQALADGGFLFSGYTQSNDVDVTGYHAGNDGWTIRTDSSGQLQWQMSLGGTADDNGWAVAEMDNGKLLTTLITGSNDGTVSGNHGADDIWVAQLSADYNQVTGRIYYDANANGQYDLGDRVLANKKITETTTGRIAFSKFNGTYSIPVFDTGSFVIVPDTVPLFVAQPASHSALFTASSGEIDTLNDFAIVADTTPVADLEVTVNTYSAFRPGFSGYYFIYCRNNGNIPQSGELVIRPDSALQFGYSSITPTTITADSVVIPIDTLDPFGYRFVLVRFRVDSVTPIGTILGTTALLNPVSGDANPGNNTATDFTRVSGSYDPNDKNVSRDYILTSEIADRPKLVYTIRFQNTGTDTAFTIVVQDTLSTLLDISTLTVEAVSHPVSVDFVNEKRLLKFSFPDILLPDSNTNELMSHGLIVYSIRPYATLGAGEDITNQAAIYFDYNAAVMTNTVHTRVIFPTSVSGHGSRQNLFIYPNPARDAISIRLPENFLRGEAEVYNTMGQRVLRTTFNQEKEISIPLGGIPGGMYFLKVNIDGQVLRATFVVSGK